jgi:hypothetical protein
MEKLFVYNFNGTIYETTTAFDDTYRKLRDECLANGEPFSRQTIKGDTIRDEYYHNGCWLDERYRNW